MLRCTRLCAMLTALSLIGADTTKPRPTLFYRIALLLLMMLMVGVDVDRIVCTCLLTIVASPFQTILTSCKVNSFGFGSVGA
ncbi:unnamed protein product [Toxocara canis]|uniref:Secreted protein n=1 Tax=Toxocara canis TaxID=6265 RepID=A0A183VAK7_TOXCA|nr:unnamed protein product [Toxocara canis]